MKPLTPEKQAAMQDLAETDKQCAKYARMLLELDQEVSEPRP